MASDEVGLFFLEEFLEGSSISEIEREAEKSEPDFYSSLDPFG